MTRTPLVMGNWKMNGSRDDNAALLRDLLLEVKKFGGIEVAVCPPAVYLDSVAQQIAGSPVRLGGQNLCEQPSAGAFTGEIHGNMLREFGCRYVLVGHSERRSLYGETDDRVAEKFVTAQSCGLVPVLCIGETLEDRESGQTETVLARQLDAVLTRAGIAAFRNAVVAYEPVWAIGTGRTASPEQAQAAHAFVRSSLQAGDAKIAGLVPLLYGGSVNADNAATLFAQSDVDGGLIGGASLKAGAFLAICAAAHARNG